MCSICQSVYGEKSNVLVYTSTRGSDWATATVTMVFQFLYHIWNYLLEVIKEWLEGRNGNYPTFFGVDALMANIACILKYFTCLLCTPLKEHV